MAAFEPRPEAQSITKGDRWPTPDVTELEGMISEVIELGPMVLARHRLEAGFDSRPLYKGLPHDMCPCEHWCYLTRGKLRYLLADGQELNVEAGQAFHLPPGHLAEVLQPAELLELTDTAAYRSKAAHLTMRIASQLDE